MIIGLCSFKGGVGKSTLAVHIARYLSEKGETLLIDGDDNASVLAWAERGTLPFKVIDEKQTAKYARNYSQIVIDSGARPTPKDLEAMADNSDVLLLVTTPDVLSLHTAQQAIAELQRLKASNFRLVLNAVPPVGNAGAEAREVITGAGVPVMRSHVRRYAAFQKAALGGTTVDRVSDPHAADAWADIVALGRELTK